MAVAKMTFIRAKNRWKIYWMRSNLTWQGYRNNPEVNKLSEALFIVNEDEDHLFWKLSLAT